MYSPSSPYFGLKQDLLTWSTAIVLSLSLHFILFLQRHNTLNATPATIVQETITQVRFSTLAPPPITVIEPEVDKPKLEPVVPPEPIVKPQAQHRPKEKSKPKKKKKPLPRPKPKVKKARTKAKTPKPVLQKQTISQDIKSKATKAIKPSPIVSKPDPRLVEQTRISYHALLMRHIEVHKRYPRVARKRKIEGNILVTFTLLKNGSIQNIQINGKKNILKKATRQAIEDALPMPKPAKNLSFPMEIKFKMNYFLK